MQEIENSVKEFFTGNEWERLAPIERTRCCNVYSNYKKLLDLDIKAQVPGFVQKYEDRCRQKQRRQQRPESRKQDQPVYRRSSPRTGNCSNKYSTGNLDSGINSESGQTFAGILDASLNECPTPQTVQPGLGTTEGIDDIAQHDAAPFNGSDTVNTVIPVKGGRGIQIKKRAKTYPCDECGYNFTTRRALRTHLANVIAQPGESRFKCAYCSHTFRRVSECTKHEYIHSPDVPITSRATGPFRNSNKLEITACDVNGRDVSSVVSRKLNAVKSLNKWTSVVHNPSRTSLKCFDCGNVFSSKTRLLNHLRLHTHVEKKYKCKECGQTFTSQRSLNLHLDLVTAEAAEGRHRCSHCSHTFRRESDCIKHEVVHNPVVAVPCCCCKRVFPTKAQVRAHARQDHQKLASLKCVECGVCFTKMSHLQRHRRNVTRDYPYQCSRCGHKFRSALALSRHIQQHDTDRQYECSFCLASFSSMSCLRQHLLSRAVPKTHRCSGCLRQFNSKNGLVKHLMVYNADRPFRCEECGHTFITQGRLVGHRRIHAEGEDWKCLSCGQAFPKKSLLQTHLQIHSGVSFNSRTSQAIKNETEDSFNSDSTHLTYSTSLQQARILTVTREFKSFAYIGLQDQSPLGKTFLQDQSPLGKTYLQEQSPLGKTYLQEQSPLGKTYLQEQSPLGKTYLQEQSPLGKTYLQEQSPLGKTYLKEQLSPLGKTEASSSSHSAFRTLQQQYLDQEMKSPATGSLDDNGSHKQRNALDSITPPGIPGRCGRGTCALNGRNGRCRCHVPSARKGKKPELLTRCCADCRTSSVAGLLRYKKLHKHKKTYKCPFCKSGYSCRDNLARHIIGHRRIVKA